MQDIAWYISLILIGLLTVIFLTFIFSNTNNDAYEDVARRDYSYRGRLFWMVIIAGVIITTTTLMPWPHYYDWAGYT